MTANTDVRREVELDHSAPRISDEIFHHAVVALTDMVRMVPAANGGTVRCALMIWAAVLVGLFERDLPEAHDARNLLAVFRAVRRYLKHARNPLHGPVAGHG